MLTHLKHDSIRFGCIKQLYLLQNRLNSGRWPTRLQNGRFGAESDERVELVDDGLQRLREQRALDVARELRRVEVRQSLEERAGLRAHVITLRALDAVATAVRAAERLIQPDNDSVIIIVIIIIEKTDAGLNGLYIRVRDINVLYDFINIYIYNKY